jgi:hypothetical protein
LTFATLPLAAHDHDVGDLGVVEWIAVGLAGLLVVWVIWRAIVLTVRPGEDDPHHIKRSILEDDAPPDGPDVEGP